MIRDVGQAKKSCTGEEFKLYRESLGGRLERFSSADLRSRRRRARALRDKYRDTYRRQRAGTRSRSRAKEVDDFARTSEKAELFENAVERFDQRIQALEAEHQRQGDEARRRGAGQRRQADQEGHRLEAARADRESHLSRATDQPRPGSEVGHPPRPARPIQRVSARSASGHFRSENRRFQARRDSRS